MNKAINEILKTPWRQPTGEQDKAEDRMLKINETERKKELKEMRTTSDTPGTMSNAPTFESQESQKKTKRKTTRKYFRR